ncbi:MAG: DUF5995 family protein [Acidimicrobiia bacterium]
MTDPIQRMEGLIGAWGPDDRRTLFATAYATMTTNMLGALGSGTFVDDDWVERLLHRFADYYFDAVDAYAAAPSGCPGPWCRAFDACGDHDLHPLRTLLLGINAHINYDLVFTLRDVLEPWDALDPSAREARRRDHESVNDVIRATVDAVQDGVVAPVAPEMGVLDRLLGPVDEWAFSALIADWRSDTWVDAVALLEAPPADRAAIEWRVERRALAVADRLAGSGAR